MKSHLFYLLVLSSTLYGSSPWGNPQGSSWPQFSSSGSGKGFGNLGGGFAWGNATSKSIQSWGVSPKEIELGNAIRDNEVGKVKLLFAEGVSAANCECRKGLSSFPPLVYAIKNDYREMIELLLKQDDVVQKINEERQISYWYRETPLSVAFEKADLQSAANLLSKGAHLSISDGSCNNQIIQFLTRIVRKPEVLDFVLEKLPESSLAQEIQKVFAYCNFDSDDLAHKRMILTALYHTNPDLVQDQKNKNEMNKLHMFYASIFTAEYCQKLREAYPVANGNLIKNLVDRQRTGRSSRELIKRGQLESVLFKLETINKTKMKKTNRILLP